MKLRNKLLTLLVGIGCIGSIAGGVNFNATNKNAEPVSADPVLEKQITIKCVSYAENLNFNYFNLYAITETPYDETLIFETDEKIFSWTGSIPTNVDYCTFTVGCPPQGDDSFRVYATDNFNTYTVSVAKVKYEGDICASMSYTTSWTFPNSDSGSYLIGDFNAWAPSDDYQLGAAISLSAGQTFDVVNVDSSHVGTFPTKPTNYVLCDGVAISGNHLICNTADNYTVTYASSIVTVTKAANPEQDAITYATQFNKAIGYGNTGAICQSDGTTDYEDLYYAWEDEENENNQSSKFAALSDDAQEYLVAASADPTSKEEIKKFAALYDYICSKYTNLTNFVGRTITKLSGGSGSSYLYRNGYNSNDNALIIIVVTSSLLVLSSAAILLVIKKKKKSK